MGDLTLILPFSFRILRRPRAVSDQTAGAVAGAHVQQNRLAGVERVQADVKPAGGHRGQALPN